MKSELSFEALEGFAGSVVGSIGVVGNVGVLFDEPAGDFDDEEWDDAVVLIVGVTVDGFDHADLAAEEAACVGS